MLSNLWSYLTPSSFLRDFFATDVHGFLTIAVMTNSKYTLWKNRHKIFKPINWTAFETSRFRSFLSTEIYSSFLSCFSLYISFSFLYNKIYNLGFSALLCYASKGLYLFEKFLDFSFRTSPRGKRCTA